MSASGGGEEAAEALAALAGRQLVLVTGKGGVGKSAIASVLGRRLSRGGRRVLVIELDPRESVHQMLGVPPSGGDIVEVAPRLMLQNLQPRRVLDGLVSKQVRIEWVAQRVRRSPVYQQFAEGAPGLKELAVLGQTVLLVEGRADGAPPVDTVVIDAPATGHGVSLLAAPRLVSEVIEHGPFGRMTAEVAEFVTDPERVAVVVVTLAEEMPVTEALELRASLDERTGRSPELLVVNGLYPPLPASEVEADDPLGVLWRARRWVNEHELERLAGAWDGPRVELPRLPLSRGPELVAELSRRLPEEPGEGAA